MIRPVSSVSFNGTKSLGAQKVARKVVNANKQAPKGISNIPIRLEGNKDGDFVTGVIKGSFNASIALTTLNLITATNVSS